MKIQNHLRRIPRPVKACVWALLAVLAAVVYYIVLGCPTLTLEQELRRAEKANLVGPSKIVDSTKKEYSEFERMLVGETEHGICFLGRYRTSYSGGTHRGETHYQFSYQEKTGDVTVAVPPNVRGSFWNLGGADLPVYVFADHEGAVRATISLRISGTRTYYNDGDKTEDPFDETYAAEATRDENGFFRFLLSGTTSDSGYALYCLSNLSCDHGYDATQRTMIIPITVELYDAEGNVILTRDLTLGPLEEPK